MNGKLIVGMLLAVAAVAGAGLWYASQYLYYRELPAPEGLAVMGEALPVEEWRGIDAESSPLKLRACFRLPQGPKAATADGLVEPTPLIAPSWFDCFDAGTLTEDIAAGRARVFPSAVNEPFGFTTFVARYSDGRAFLWRQMNRCGEAAYRDETLPPECGARAETSQPRPGRTD